MKNFQIFLLQIFIEKYKKSNIFNISTFHFMFLPLLYSSLFQKYKYLNSSYQGINCRSNFCMEALQECHQHQQTYCQQFCTLFTFTNIKYFLNNFMLFVILLLCFLDTIVLFANSSVHFFPSHIYIPFLKSLFNFFHLMKLFYCLPITHFQYFLKFILFVIFI